MKKETTKIKIIDEIYTSVIRAADPNDEWDADDLSENHYIEGFKISDDYYDLVIGFIPEAEKTYYWLL